MLDEQHQLTIINREKVTINGVLHIVNYDESTIELKTTAGALIIKGNNFNVTNLNLETGNLEIDGKVTSLNYREGQDIHGKNLWQRLLK